MLYWSGLCSHSKVITNKNHMKKVSYLLAIAGFLAIMLGIALPPAMSVSDSKVSAPTDKIGSDCSFKGVPLHGKVKIVESFPDFKVKVVNSFPDLKVKIVNSFPDDCGEWQFTESFPDFKIQIVESFPDFSIQYVESFPGLP